MGRRRADLLVVEQGLALSRARAQALILAGVVLGQGEQRVEKPGQLLDEGVSLTLKGQPLKYVSRGGLKLEAALSQFTVDVSDRVCLDVGASTGGFTDCLLQHGAKRVYAVDVGYGQLAWQLRQDPRVVVIERSNIRTLEPSAISELCQLVVIDVSFISLKLVVPRALVWAAPEARLVALVKPQFEVGRREVGKRGVVRDPAARQRVLQEVVAMVESQGIVDVATMVSPLLGAEGNEEFLLSGRMLPRCGSLESG